MTSSLRILFTVHGYKPAYRIGGPILSVSGLAEALIQNGHHVTVFTTNCNMSQDLDVPVDCPQQVDGVEVWYFHHEEWIKKIFPSVTYLSKSMGYLYAPAMAKALDKMVPAMDLVHTHQPFIYPTVATARAARVHHKPLFYHQRGIFDPEHLNFRSFKKRLYIKMIEGPILKSATTLIALTEAEKTNYHTWCPSVPSRVIPNGINGAEYWVKPHDPAILDLPLQAPVVLFLGRLHPFKGADKLMEAFFRICQVVPDVLLVMAGPDEFMIEDRFRAMVKQKGLEGRIIFPGMVEGRIKKDLLARADLFCLPSDGEGFSMAILEALASATAVMISPGCHFPEIEPAGAGKVVQADPELMAQMMIELLKDRKQLQAMGQRARAFVLQNYSWDKIADDMVDAYQEGVARYLKAQG